MKKTAVLALAAVFLAPLAGLVSGADVDDNDGVLNGPLKEGGHKATHEGTKESLEMAIKDLIETHGDQYPRGAEFLGRLGTMKDSSSEGFEDLKREALSANPLLGFEKVILVRSQAGTRFARNWQTRVSTPAATRLYSQKEVDSILRSAVGAKDHPLRQLSRDASAAEKAATKFSDTVSKSDAYRNEKDKKKKNLMLKDNPEYKGLVAKSKELKEALHKTAMRQVPEYADAYEKLINKTPVTTYGDELIILSLSDGKITPVYAPEGRFIGDVDLHWDGNRVLFTSHRDLEKLADGPGVGKGFATFELLFDPKTGRALKGRTVTPDMGRDVDCFDACYLPDERIVFASTASYQGVPCVGGSSYVANLYRMDRDGSNVRRITFDQDSEWHPVVQENGRVMFTRWEYTDSAHYYSRVLMTMNPDGTDQKAFYGSNSYWPNSMFDSRPIPGKPSMFISTISGHHDTSKNGPLVLFDVIKGRHEADGAVQLLTAHGKEVHPIVHDGLTKNYSPHFTQPYPLSEKYFLAVKGGSIYLLDIFDNMLCLKPSDGTWKYYEPIPLRKTPRPKVQPDRIDLSKDDATVLINDVYTGPGLRGVPRGTVKKLRVYRYEFAPRHAGGHYAMGMEAGWDAKQVLGTAPVEDDGSASFKVPANTPFAIQPLDENGRALQLMRSWTVAMPGESLSCIGCHESQNTSPSASHYKAMLRRPSKLEPFYGPTRGFGFNREVQPVLNQYCAGCHDGTHDLDENGRDKAGRYTVADRIIGTGPQTGEKFTECGIPDLSAEGGKAYVNLHPYVRRNGPEGDYHLLTPLEFHAGTSELFQMLEKGHHGVKLDRESWDRLATWADLNAPLHGRWTEAPKANPEVLARRLELRKLYASIDFNPEAVIATLEEDTSFVKPAPVERQVVPVEESVVKDGRAGETAELDLGNGVAMKVVSIPTGEFSMGSNRETPVEQPVSRVSIDEPFQMGATEVTLRQYRQFDPEYLNGVYDMHYKDQVHRGYYMNDMDFPVIRVTWEKAQEFCKWLSEKTGKQVSLPTEAEWEWACRAGTTTPFSYGDLDADFSKLANFSDSSVAAMAVKGVNPKPISNPSPEYDYELKDPRSNDGVLHLAEVGSYEANPWGLYDMHGNAAEWTLSDYKPYPYDATDGRDDGGAGEKVVRGGSWHDRPFRSTSSFRLGFPAWQQVYHTGFRVVVK